MSHVRDFRATLVVLAFALIIVAGAYYYVERTQTEIASSINHSACTLRSYLNESLVRAKKAAVDPTSSKGTRERNLAAIPILERLTSNQITVPRGYDCRAILKP